MTPANIAATGDNQMTDQPTITIVLSGCDTATCGSITVKCARNAIHKIATAIEATGVHPAEMVRIVRDTGAVCFSDEPLGFWSSHVISETDQGIRRVKWKPLPEGAFA